MIEDWEEVLERLETPCQPPENWFVIGANDLELRPCLETIVDVFKI